MGRRWSLRASPRSVDAADRSTGPAFEGGRVGTRRKDDGSSVTTTDIEVEATLRSLIARAHPEDTVLGEEDGGQMSSSCWIIDPIDGTENFVRKNPVRATLIAHMQDGELDLAAASAPALGHRWWAGRGQGAFRDGRPLGVSAVERLEDATLAFGGLHEFPPETVGSLVALAQAFRLSWGWGNF